MPQGVQIPDQSLLSSDVIGGYHNSLPMSAAHMTGDHKIVLQSSGIKNHQK